MLVYTWPVNGVLAWQAAEAAKKAEAAKAKAADGPQLEDDDADDLDPNQYYERRVRGVASAKAAGRYPYPHKFHISTYLPEYVAKYKDLEPGAKLTEDRVSVAGAAFLFSQPDAIMIDPEALSAFPWAGIFANLGSFGFDVG